MAFCGYLKQSTAVDVLLGPFVDDSDGKTAETGLTLDVELSKNGQALANKNDADTATHDAAGDIDGFYNCELDATDTNTLGILTICAYASGALVCRQDYQVVTANWYDSMCSTENLDVNVKEVSDDSTAADTLELFAEALDQATGQLDSGSLHDDTITAASIATGALSADAFAADALVAATFATDSITSDALADGTITAAKLGADCITADKIADDAITTDHLATGAVTADTLAADCITEAKIADDAIGDEHIDASFMGTDGKVLVSTDAQDLSATLDVNTKAITAGAITAAAIATDAIDADALAADAIAEINATVDTALADINLDHLMKTGDATLTNIVADNTALAHLMTDGADISDYDSSTDSLEAIAGAGGGGAPTVEQIRAEIDSNSTQLAAIVADTNELQTNQGNWATATGFMPDTEDGSSFTAVPWNASWDAEAQSECADAITAAGVSTHSAADVKTAIEAAGSHLALIKAVTDALTAAAAGKLATSAGTMVTGTVSHDNVAATTTVFYCDDITEATADHYNGRIVIFTSGDLQYQATDITDYELSGGEGKFTVTALTEAPADNVTFIIV